MANPEHPQRMYFTSNDLQSKEFFIFSDNNNGIISARSGETMKKLRTAIIGYGMSGKTIHLPVLLKHPHFEVTVIMTRQEERIKEINTLYPEIDVVTDYVTVVEDPNIDLVIIATSNDKHYEYTKEALLHYKHVLCEKPFVDTYTKAKELFDIAKANDVLLRVYHNRKYDGDVLTIKKLFKEKDFGTLVSYHARFDRYQPIIQQNWRFDLGHMAGIYYDLAPHLVHHAIELFGLPELVFNTLYDDREHTKVDDHFEMVLYYQTHTVLLGSHMLDRYPKPRFEIIGTKASYVKVGQNDPEFVAFDTQKIYQDNVEVSEFITTLDSKETIPVMMGQHYLFYENFYHDVMEHTTEDLDKNLALSVILVMQLGLVSHQTKQMMKVPHKIT